MKNAQDFRYHKWLVSSYGKSIRKQMKPKPIIEKWWGVKTVDGKGFEVFTRTLKEAKTWTCFRSRKVVRVEIREVKK